uniref:Uncharacterized protein n=1 Tax=Cyprinus carpio TaxID=7962 RepID=A0A8C2L6J8_CYPCA
IAGHMDGAKYSPFLEKNLLLSARKLINIYFFPAAVMNLSLLMVSYMNFDYLSLRCLQAVSKAAELLLNPDAPAIPSPGQAFGYEEDAQGVLHRHKPQPETRHSARPYSPVPELLSSQKYQGVRFRKMSGRREQHCMVCLIKWLILCFPVCCCVCVLYENVNLKRGQKGRSELDIPQYHELVALEGEEGPGQYYIKSQFEMPSNPHAPGLSPPFLSQTQRFSPVKDETPPVGAYDDPRCVKKNPFSLTAVCFLPENRPKATPGPGAYNVFEYGLAYESLKNACLESTRKGAFGSIAPCRLFLPSKEEMSRPGPTQYKVSSSSTQKVSSNDFSWQDTPLPGSYNMSESFEKIHGLHHYSEPRSKKARKLQSCFLSAAPRDPAFLHYDPETPGDQSFDSYLRNIR